jgi:hypothetical protein
MMERVWGLRECWICVLLCCYRERERERERERGEREKRSSSVKQSEMPKGHGHVYVIYGCLLGLSSVLFVSDFRERERERERESALLKLIQQATQVDAYSLEN